MEVGRPAIDGIVAERLSLYICSKAESYTEFRDKLTGGY